MEVDDGGAMMMTMLSSICLHPALHLFTHPTVADDMQAWFTFSSSYLYICIFLTFTVICPIPHTTQLRGLQAYLFIIFITNVLFNIIVMLLYLRVCVPMPLCVVGVGCGVGARWDLGNTNMHSSRRHVNVREKSGINSPWNRPRKCYDLMHSKLEAHIMCFPSPVHPNCQIRWKSAKSLNTIRSSVKHFPCLKQNWCFQGVACPSFRWGWCHQPLLMLLWKHKGLGNNLLQKKMVDNKVKCTQGGEGVKNMKVGIWQMWQQQQRTCKA